MEIITLHFGKAHMKNRREVAEAYIRQNIIGKENPAVLVAGLEPQKGRDKVFQVLVLNNIEKPLQFDDGKIYRHQIEEGQEKMCLEYLSKFACVFVCK